MPQNRDQGRKEQKYLLSNWSLIVPTSTCLFLTQLPLLSSRNRSLGSRQPGWMLLHPEAGERGHSGPTDHNPKSSNHHLSGGCIMRMVPEVSRVTGWQDLGTEDSVWAIILLLQLASTYLPRKRRHSCPAQCRCDQMWERPCKCPTPRLQSPSFSNPIPPGK